MVSPLHYIVRCLEIRMLIINASKGKVETSNQDVHQASVPPNGPSTWYPAASKDLQEFLHEENQKKQKLCLAQMCRRTQRKKRGKKKIMKKEKKEKT